MEKSKDNKRDGISKITIYKLTNSFSIKKALSNYKEPKNGIINGWSYRIFVRSKPNISPAWLPLVKNLLNENDIPKNSYASLVILFSKNKSLFALTAGYGYASVRNYAVGDFGIDIACKSLDSNQLDHLYQKVPTGNVYGLVRSLRGKYMPTNDPTNKRSVLKALRGKVINQGIGVTMEGRTSLAISGKKDFPDVIKVLDEILRIEKSDKITVHIKGLDEVLNDLREKLDQELISKINGDQFDDVLFGYDDDLVFKNCEKLRVGRDRTYYSIDDILGVLYTAKKQNNTNPAHVGVIGYDEQNVEIFKKKLIDLIEGELDYKGNKYFRIDRKWYKTNIEYKKKIEKDFKNIKAIGQDYFTQWPKDKDGFINEDKFLKDNAGQDKIVAHAQKLSQIEFADIIDKQNNYLIHVKKGKGAYLRNLFAQGYVSASLFNGDEDFKKSVKDKFKINVLNRFTIVFAIFPEGETNVDSIFTLFAKVDFLERHDSLKEMGFDVKYCLIRE